MTTTKHAAVQERGQFKIYTPKLGAKPSDSDPSLAPRSVSRQPAKGNTRETLALTGGLKQSQTRATTAGHFFGVGARPKPDRED